MPSIEGFQRKITAALESYGASLPQFLIGALVFAIFWFAGGVLRRGIRKAMNRVAHDDGTSRVVARLSRSIFLVLGFLVASSIAFPGFSFSALVTTLGLGSVAIGFAFKDIIENFLAGLILLVSRPFRIGDVVEMQGRRGTITNIETRTTQIRLFNGEYVIMPNAVLMKDPIVVVSREPVRRYEVVFGADYAGDLGQLRAFVLDAVTQTKGVVPDPKAQVVFEKLNTEAVQVKALWWVDNRESDSMSVNSAVIESVQRALADQGLRPPLPTQTLVMGPPGNVETK